jgi:signal peptidase I
MDKMEKLNNSEEKNESIGNQIRDYVLSIALAVIIAIVLKTYVFQRADVEGRSMEATLWNKDIIFVEKLSVLAGRIKRGQIVIFDSGNESGDIYVKRVIAVEDDEIEIKEGKVYLNGAELKEDYLSAETLTEAGSFMQDNRRYKVAKHQVFVLGDNRAHSKDSREIGPVDIKDIKGHAILRAYPFNRINIF